MASRAPVQTPLELTYFRAIEVDGSGAPITIDDIKTWHRVRIPAPLADMKKIFRWKREVGTRQPTATAEYNKIAAMLSRSFYRFVDIDTPTVETITDDSGNPIEPILKTYALNSLSFTSPPTAAAEYDTESPAPTAGSSILLPTTFNTLILRWVLWKLYHTSRPKPGSVTGLAKAYNLQSNLGAAKGIASDLSDNPVYITDMMSELTTNAQERYFNVDGGWCPSTPRPMPRSTRHGPFWAAMIQA